MLSLKNITKDYETEEVVHALRGVSINFRQNEFVAILGPSGCGKTTLLNIIGGLDHYTDGDLVIGGTSTKEYEDRDWDSYRNHRVGFVFQSYNLIPHQTVLSNVELALTLSGVSRQERRARAAAALESVGLGDQLKKRPNQMSGGQMQRVAIARALVNNPDIVLADEPTGALDTHTSVQIMEILKEISKDKLIVMVTHNPELAEQYASRIIRVVDGQVVDDSNPYDGKEDIPLALPVEEMTTPAPAPKKQAKKKKKQKTSMSFLTALSLSLNNLMTKKARTFLVSFAGSIGIIGIALVLALSNGIQLFIDKVQEDTLSSYPIAIESSTMDINSLLSAFAGESGNGREVEDGYIYTNSQLEGMAEAIKNGYKENDLKAFREYIESASSQIKSNAVVQYRYGVTPQIYINRDGTYLSVSPSSIFDTLMGVMGSDSSMGMTVWDEMIDNQELLESQYELLEGKWPTAYNEVVLVTDKNHGISDLMLYALGIKDPKEFENLFTATPNPNGVTKDEKFTYEELMGVSFRMVLSADYYRKKADGTYEDLRKDAESLNALIANSSEEIKIVGIIAASPDATATSISGVIGYSHLLTDYIMDKTLEKDEHGNYIYSAVGEQLANPTKDIFTDKLFYVKDTSTDEEKAEKFATWLANASDAEKAIQYDENLSSIVFTELFTKQYVMLVMQYPAKNYMTGEDIDTTTYEPALREAIATCLANDVNLLNRLKQNFPDMIPNSMTADGLNAVLANQGYDMLMMVLATLRVYENNAYDIAYADQQAAALNMTTAEKAAAYVTYANTLVNNGGGAELWDTYLKTGTSPSTYKTNLRLLGVADEETPTAIYIYPKSFDAKEAISEEIDQYNKTHNSGEISFTDYIGIMLSSISVILDVITYVLVAFVSISLVVSSIMIGIITYISVLERIKEIGILRAIGASKTDVSRVFLAETLIVGFAAGMIGIIVTLLLSIPVNLIIQTLSGFGNIGAKLPFVGAVALVAISMGLTLIAGLIPAKIAAKKEPVEALRSE